MPVRIGIISEFRVDTVNYGNQLQAYALGSYLKKIDPECKVTYIIPETKKKRRTLILGVIFRKIWEISKRYAQNSRSNQNTMAYLEKRFDAFAQFRKDEFISEPEFFSWERLLKSDFDILIVGSDVVWVQERFNINRFTFLDFKSKTNTRKIAYAASFGRAWIPPENKFPIQKCLRNFQMISVRESSSIRLLHSIGIDDVWHVLDPTLLIDACEWERIERMPYVGMNGGIENATLQAPYAFAYLLDVNEEQRHETVRICKENSLRLISIPYANGKINEDGISLDEIEIMNCSPREWIWLIHHASCVITNSFHGIVFSTIFEKKFLAAKRIGTMDINERIYDYLKTIQQQDKLVDLKHIGKLDAMCWDYGEISRQLDQKKIISKDFLAQVCIECTKEE